MSSRKIDKRHMKAYRVDVERHNGEARFVVSGQNESGRLLQFTVDTNFYQIRCLIRQFQKAWAGEKESRVREINSIDEALPTKEL